MFRTLGKSKIGFVLAILFGISLLFFKSGSRYSNFFNSDSVVAKVSDTKISTTKFNRVMQMNINKFNQMLNKKMTGDEIRAFQIHNLALKALINDAVFEDEFNSLNFKIDEKLIALKTKEKIPQLYDSNNNLNELYLSTFLQQQQLQIEDLVQIVNYETRDEFFSNTFFNINYPIYFTNKINKFDNHERKITYLEIELDKISDKKILDKYSNNLDSELNDFYQENIARYMSEERRDIEYILIDKSEIEKNTIIESFRIKEYYNENKKSFFKNEKRSFIQFNFKTELDANNFIKNINGFNLNETINYAKNKDIRFSDFEKLEKNEILNQIAEPLFDLKINEKSQVIKTSLANHILILKSITPSYQLSFNESKDEIKNMIKKIQTNNEYTDLINSISNSIINGSRINEISNLNKLNIQVLKNISRDFSDFEKAKEKLFFNLIKSTFEANKDFVSNIITIDDDLSFFFNVTKIKKSIPKKFSKIKEEVFKDWKNIKIIEYTKENIAKNIDNKMFIENLSIENNTLPVKTQISKSNNELPNNVVNKIFNSDINLNIQELYESTIFVIMINDILIPKDSNEKKLISLAGDLRNSFGNEIMKNKKISTNENLINAIIEQY